MGMGLLVPTLACLDGHGTFGTNIGVSFTGPGLDAHGTFGTNIRVNEQDIRANRVQNPHSFQNPHSREKSFSTSPP